MASFVHGLRHCCRSCGNEGTSLEADVATCKVVDQIGKRLNRHATHVAEEILRFRTAIDRQSDGAVSYTHLTRPTIDSV